MGDQPNNKESYYEKYPPKPGYVHIGWGTYRPENEPISPVISKPGEFTEHDSTYGHCGLCGRLGCHGGCFK